MNQFLVTPSRSTASTYHEHAMKITEVKLYKVPLTSHETYYMADGKTCDSVDSMVIAILTDTDHIGWGEVCPIPHYLPAYANGVASALQELEPALIGADPIGPEALMSRLNAFLLGHDYAKSAIDTALWDLTAKAAQLPLYRLLGGRQAQQLPLYRSITCIEPDAMAQIAIETKQSGIKQFQVKLGVDNNWRRDVQRLTSVREAVGDDALVYGDWNCGGSQLDTTRVGRAVAHLDIMLEQPCKTIEECANVKRSCNLPMKMDESAHDIPSLLKAYEHGCMDAVALKLSKFGGLSAMRQARDLCIQLGAKMCIEDTWGSDISTATALHLGTATPSNMLLNVCDLSGYVRPRIDSKGPTRASGSIQVSEQVGHGITPDPNVLGNPILCLPKVRVKN